MKTGLDEHTKDIEVASFSIFLPMEPSVWNTVFWARHMPLGLLSREGSGRFGLLES